MSFDKKQFRDLVTRILQEFNLYSEAAVNLLLGTAAQESYSGTYLRQISGPALGIFQMERPTFDWLKDTYKKKYPILETTIFEMLEWDLRLAILMARLRYRVVREALPDPQDLEGLGKYWKKYYNTPLGKGTVEEFLRNYARYVLLP